jgi:hypothetical protein
MPDVQRRRSSGGRRRLLRLTATLAILAVPAALGLQSAGAAQARSAARLATSSSGDTRCTTTAARVTTCTGTYSGNRAWILSTGKELPASKPPIVTVSPTTDLVSQVVDVSWQNFAPTLYTGTLSPEPNANDGSEAGSVSELYNVAIYECSGTVPEGPANYDGNAIANNCYALTDTTQVQAQQGASNGVIGFTSANGTGQAEMYVEAGAENSFLKCGPTSPCSLLVLPNWGGLDAITIGSEKLKTDCTVHTWDDGGPLHTTYMAGYQYLGGDCSWDDRIVVPLTFAPTPLNCPTNATPAFQSFGSPMMEAAMEQWLAGDCVGKSPVLFQYTSEDEYTARQQFLQGGSGALSASADMALVTQPATAADSNGILPTERQYTYAPLANSAIAFAYYIDDPNTGTPFTDLVLNARLAAKLLTQSYALGYDCTSPPPFNEPKPPAASSTCDPAVSHNPDTIFDDPEFFSLNGGDTKANISNFPNDSSFPDTLYGPFVPTVVAGTSDMTYELTGWIASDPDAHAFLDGQRETEGGTSMAVNKNYRDVAYPTSQFQVLDPGWTTSETSAPGGITSTMGVSWNPDPELDNVATDLATYDPSADSPVAVCAYGNSAQCQGNTGYENPRLPGEFLGQDEMTAVVAYSQAAADGFPVFRLVNAAGKAVAPTTSSIVAALSQMKTNPDGITQSMNFANKDPDAYPLTMVDYAMVPTCGLSAAKASAISAFLTDVATRGQTPGYLPGQLAPGYVPLTSHQLAQLKTAASTVQSKGQQQCSKSGGTGGPGNGSTAGGSGGGAGGGGSARGTHSTTTAELGNSKRGASNAGYAVKNPFTAGLGRFILPLLVVLGGLLALGGPVAYVLSVTGAGPVVYRRIGALPRRVTGLVRGTLVRRT